MPTRLTGSPAEQARGGATDRARRAAVRGLWWWRAHRFLDRAGDRDATGLLLGSARSGTTWLGELIDRHRDHRILFEPFRPDAVPQMRAFSGVRYLRPDAADDRWRRPVERLLAGELRNPWVDHTSSALVARRRLLKDVRANCLAPWLAAQFPANPLVLVLRHPVAIALSRRALRWEDSLADYLADDALVADHLDDQQVDVLNSLTDPVVRSVGQWAVETVVPLRMLGPDQVCLVHYEQLRRDPVGEATRVVRHLGQEPDGRLEAAAGRPSRTVRPAEPSAAAGLSAGQLDGAALVLRAFGLDGVYSVGDEDPQPGAAQALLAS